MADRASSDAQIRIDDQVGGAPVGGAVEARGQAVVARRRSRRAAAARPVMVVVMERVSMSCVNPPDRASAGNLPGVAVLVPLWTAVNGGRSDVDVLSYFLGSVAYSSWPRFALAAWKPTYSWLPSSISRYMISSVIDRSTNRSPAIPSYREKSSGRPMTM